MGNFWNFYTCLVYIYMYLCMDHYHRDQIEIRLMTDLKSIIFQLLPYIMFLDFIIKRSIRCRLINSLIIFSPNNTRIPLRHPTPWSTVNSSNTIGSGKWISCNTTRRYVKPFRYLFITHIKHIINNYIISNYCNIVVHHTSNNQLICF